MSGLDPSGASQPTLTQAYTTAGNPAETGTSEKASALANEKRSENAPATDVRKAGDQTRSHNVPTASSLGRGVHGAGPGEERYGTAEEDIGRHNELDGEQMSAPGEGKVRDAVVGNRSAKGGGSGEQIDLASDLDRKKAEQAPAREAVTESRGRNVDVAGVLGHTGGPANPVDKDHYPNSGH